MNYSAATGPSAECLTILLTARMLRRNAIGAVTMPAKPTAKSAAKTSAAKSNAERQAAYRQRHLHNVDGGGALLNVVVSVHTKAQLERLATHYGVTQRALIERLAGEGESAVTGGLRGRALKAYYDG